MAAPTQGWQKTNQETGATPPFLLGEQSIPAGEVLTVELLNVSEIIELENTGDYPVRVGVLDVASAGVQGDAYRLLEAGKSLAVKWSVKQLVVYNPTGAGGAATITGSITLTGRDADDVRALTDANDFDGVQSHNSTRVAVAAKAS